MVLFCAAAAAVFAADILTKYLISSGMELYSSITLIPGVFSLTYIVNEGAAWGFLADKQLILNAFTFVVIACICAYAVHKRSSMPKMELCALGLIVGGGLGNLIERMIFGHVVDFIDFTFWSVFNIMNIADLGIAFGCLLLLISIFKQGSKEKKDAEKQDI